MIIRHKQSNEIFLRRKLARVGAKYKLLGGVVRLIINSFTSGLKVVGDENLYQSVLAKLDKNNIQDCEVYLNELKSNELLKQAFERAKSEKILEFNLSFNDFVNRYRSNAILFYCLVRETRPEIVIETGTANGFMTSWLLAALNKNGKGKLISIDLPPVEGKLTMNITLEGDQIGRLIPKEYRSQWEYKLGDARLLLSKVLQENDPDIFIHDSLHTRTHMAMEYYVARSFMRDKTLIMSDDILWNNSFAEFIDNNHLDGYHTLSNPDVGVCVNTFDGFEKESGLYR
jgi:predicted O-methyltransferase YrrM